MELLFASSLLKLVRMGAAIRNTGIVDKDIDILTRLCGCLDILCVSYIELDGLETRVIGLYEFPGPDIHFSRSLVE